MCGLLSIAFRQRPSVMRFAILPLLYLFALPATAQQEASFDPVAALARIENARLDLNVLSTSQDALSALANDLEALDRQAQRCSERAEAEFNALESNFILLDEIEQLDDFPDLFARRVEVRRQRDESKGRQATCDTVRSEADALLGRVAELRADLSERFLYESRPSLSALLIDLPNRWQRWRDSLRNSFTLKLNPGFSHSGLLLALFLAGLGGGVVGIWIRRLFSRWYLAGATQSGAPELRFLFPKPLAHYAPLILQGVLLSIVLALGLSNASADLPVMRLALALVLFAAACVIIEWATGPLSPSANVKGLIPDHVKPLRRRLYVLALVLVTTYVLTGQDWMQQRSVATDAFLNVLVLGALGLTMLGALFYLRRIPGLRGRFGVVRYAAMAAILVGLLSLILGYQNFAAFLINGVVQTVIALIFLWISLWLTVTAFESLASGDSALARNIGDTLGHSSDRPNSVVGFMQLAIDVLIWAFFGLFLVNVWDSSGTAGDGISRLFMEGGEIGKLSLRPLDILTGIVTFAGLIILTNWVRRWIDRRWFHSLGLDRGARDALVTLIGYVGFVVAALIGLSVASIDLSGLTFVVTALAVGIGFGLQAITSNFVSGLILLLERPIKAGDFVTVGDVEGFIRQIRIRATEIETLDDQNVLVPNSELVSGRVTNWVLRDPRGRIQITVGVAYGSDVELVRDLLVEIARQHPEVISDGSAPAPRALFMTFGESSLDFELRVRIRRIERRYTVQSDLNFSIYAAFSENNIGIPFPQRDIHIIDRQASAATPIEPSKKQAKTPRARDEITRSQKHKVTIEATIEAVWSALTNEERVTRWLESEVDMTARIGGTVTIRRANDTVIRGRIDMFMPPRKLRLVIEPPEGDEPLSSGPIMEAIQLSQDRDEVLVEVLVTGIPASEDWAQYSRLTEDRWTNGLKQLKNLVEKNV